MANQTPAAPPVWPHLLLWLIHPPLARPAMGCPLGRLWPTARAIALLRVDPTQSSETGTVRGLRWHNRPRETKGVRRRVRIGQAGRGRARGDERPMGAAACGGRGFKESERVSGERPIGAASCRQQCNQASCQHPPSAPQHRHSTDTHQPPPPKTTEGSKLHVGNVCGKRAGARMRGPPGGRSGRGTTIPRSRPNGCVFPTPAVKQCRQSPPENAEAFARRRDGTCTFLQPNPLLRACQIGSLLMWTRHVEPPPPPAHSLNLMGFTTFFERNIFRDFGPVLVLQKNFGGFGAEIYPLP